MLTTTIWLSSYCNLWSHNKCSLVDRKQYKYHQLNPDVPFLCLKCKEDNIPFMKMNNFEYASHILKDTNIVDTNFAPNSSQKLFFDKINKEIRDYNTRFDMNEDEFEFNSHLL